MPRKCAATGRLIEAKDHASVQIAVADVDENGKIIPGRATNIPISGAVRHMGEADDSLNRIAQEQGRTYQKSGSRSAPGAQGPCRHVAPDSLRLDAAEAISRRAQDSSFVSERTAMRRIRAYRLSSRGPASVRPAQHPLGLATRVARAGS